MPYLEVEEWGKMILDAEKQEERIAELEKENAEIAAANESMQEDAAQNTIGFKHMLKANKELTTENAAIKATIEDVKYYVGNPSAWDHYDDGVSEKIRAILKAAGMA